MKHFLKIQDDSVVFDKIDKFTDSVYETIQPYDSLNVILDRTDGDGEFSNIINSFLPSEDKEKIRNSLFKNFGIVEEPEFLVFTHYR